MEREIVLVIMRRTLIPLVGDGKGLASNSEQDIKANKKDNSSRRNRWARQEKGT